jgi:hypothetical protein
MSDLDQPAAEQPAAVPLLKAKEAPKWIPVLPKNFVPPAETPDSTGWTASFLDSYPQSIRKKFSLESAFASFELKSEADAITRQKWGIEGPVTEGDSLPPGVFSFAEAVKQPWCKNQNGTKKTVFGLHRLCESIDYPPVLLERQLLSEVGFDRALALQKEKEKQRNTDRHRAGRGNRPRRRSGS